jgi:hypothetical protein
VWAEDANDRRLATIRENEGLLAITRELGLPSDAPFVFLCECADPLCTDYVKLTLAEYDERRSRDGCVTVPGHRVPAQPTAA